MAFSYRQLKTNTVLRWEYRPGSTLFVVWAHGRESYVPGEQRRPWAEDLGEILDADADNTFLIKLSYWLNR